MVRLVSLEGNLRFGLFCKKHRLRLLARIARGFQRVVFCSDIPYSETIDASVHYNHKGFGIVIHPDTIIGAGTDIQHGVTIGEISNIIPPPRIGRNVYIGAKATILGNISIGDNAKIGAGALVLCDVPPNATAVGVPAKILEASK